MFEALQFSSDDGRGLALAQPRHVFLEVIEDGYLLEALLDQVRGILFGPDEVVNCQY